MGTPRTVKDIYRFRSVGGLLFPPLACKTAHMQLQLPVTGNSLYDKTVGLKSFLAEGSSAVS